MFDTLNLSGDILRALEKQGFTIPTEIQTKCIPLIAGGSDVVGRSKTGTGKTFAFALPAIDKVDTELNAVQVIVLCPTRELALQVTDEIRKITSHIAGIKIVPVYGGADIERQIKQLRQAKIVIGTPGRVLDHIRRHTIKLDMVKMAVLDEADEMLNMGFKEDIETILKNTPKTKQTVMFSATMPPPIKAITKDYMLEPQYIELGELNSTLIEIEQSYISIARNGKKQALLELFGLIKPKRAIVFSNTKKMADEIRKHLADGGIEALALHGDMRQSERRRVMDHIKTHKTAVLVATDVAARGIDIDDVDYIINYDLPNDVEYYIHRIGRTARAGKSGSSITLINTKEQLIKLNEYKRITKSSIIKNSISDRISTHYDIGSSFNKPETKVAQVNYNNDKDRSKPYKKSYGTRGPIRHKTEELNSEQHYRQSSSNYNNPDYKNKSKPRYDSKGKSYQSERPLESNDLTAEKSISKKRPFTESARKERYPKADSGYNKKIKPRYDSKGKSYQSERPRESNDLTAEKAISNKRPFTESGRKERYPKAGSGYNKNIKPRYDSKGKSYQSERPLGSNDLTAEKAISNKRPFTESERKERYPKADRKQGASSRGNNSFKKNTDRKYPAKRAAEGYNAPFEGNYGAKAPEDIGSQGESKKRQYHNKAEDGISNAGNVENRRTEYDTAPKRKPYAHKGLRESSRRSSADSIRRDGKY